MSEQRYRIGYYCPRGDGHLELMRSGDFSAACGSKGWDVYLAAESGDEGLPEGEWVAASLPSWAELMELLDERYPPDVFVGGPDADPGPQIVALAREVDRLRQVEQDARDIANCPDQEQRASLVVSRFGEPRLESPEELRARLAELEDPS